MENQGIKEESCQHTKEEDPENDDYKSCEAYGKLTSKFGDKVNYDELLSLAEILSHHFNVPLIYEDSSNMRSLVFWYNNNFDVLWPCIEHKVKIGLSNGTVI